MSVVFIAGLQFLILQLFNFLAVKDDIDFNKKIYYFFLIFILTPIGSWLSSVSSVVSGLFFTFVLILINYYWTHSSSLTTLYPLLCLVMSLMVFLILNCFLIFIHLSKILDSMIYIVSFLLGGILSFLIQNFLLKKFSDIIFQKKINRFFLINFLIIILILVLSTFELNLAHYIKVDKLVIESIFLVILIIFILLLVINFLYNAQKFRYNNFEKQIHQLEDYSKVLEKNFNELSKFKHDYINVISASLIFIKNKDLNGMEAYYKEALRLLDASFIYDNLKISDLQNVNPRSVKGFLSYQLISSYQKKININFECLEPIKIKKEDTMSVIEIIEIILQVANNYVYKNKGVLNFLITKGNDYVSFLIKYSILKDDANPQKVHEIFEETLSKHSTYDDKSLKELVTASKNIELLSSYRKDFLIQEILINNEE